MDLLCVFDIKPAALALVFPDYPYEDAEFFESRAEFFELTPDS